MVKGSLDHFSVVLHDVGVGPVIQVLVTTHLVPEDYEASMWGRANPKRLTLQLQTHPPLARLPLGRRRQDRP